MNNTYEFWRKSVLADAQVPLSQERIEEMFAATCRYGSGNLWTGTNGTLAAYIRELLREREHLLNHGSPP